MAKEFLEVRGYTVQDRQYRMQHGAPLPWRPELNYGWISERLG